MALACAAAHCPKSTKNTLTISETLRITVSVFVLELIEDAFCSIILITFPNWPAWNFC